MFLRVKAQWSDFFHDGRVLTMAVSMVFAGSETTAISLAAIFYFLLDSPPPLLRGSSAGDRQRREQWHARELE